MAAPNIHLNRRRGRTFLSSFNRWSVRRKDCGLMLQMKFFAALHRAGYLLTFCIGLLLTWVNGCGLVWVKITRLSLMDWTPEVDSRGSQSGHALPFSFAMDFAPPLSLNFPNFCDYFVKKVSEIRKCRQLQRDKVPLSGLRPLTIICKCWRAPTLLRS